MDLTTSAAPEARKRTLIPVARYTKFRSDLTQGTVDSLMLDRFDNGVAPHVLRISGRLYLIEEEWDQWLLTHREAKK